MQGFGRPEDALGEATPWYLWGPYLSERAWGTVREDYSADGDAWSSFPHDHSRSRAYRWGEDGLAGVCDVFQRLCFAFAFWNGRDPILKERVFGLTGPQGNHGEDAKEYWWYLDAVPSHAWLRWRYHYPQRPFPYDDLVAENARRGRHEPEYELLDTGAFDDDRYWIVEVEYAKADPTDLCVRVRVTNAGPDADTLHVLPSLWFRNTWTWEPGAPRPSVRCDGDAVVAHHPELGRYALRGGPGPDGAVPTPLFCDNETNVPRLFGGPAVARFPKDGINDHVVSGAATVNPAREGTKAALWYQVPVEAGGTVELRLRLGALAADGVAPSGGLGKGFSKVLDQRRAEADEFYAELTPLDASDDEGMVMRQAFAGMIWGKQYYGYDVSRWLDGDPGQPPPPASRLTGRNARWRNVEAADVLSMPDPWEYPWFAAWDLAFHAVVFAHIDPAFAKYQLLVMVREWFQHPDGALPAYEWSFDDVNPPVHAWAAFKVFMIDGGRDTDFLERVFHKLLLNFTWWVNREDADGSNLFEGGFLGLDNIGPIDRSHIPAGEQLEQSDATSWMAYYCLSMLAIAITLARHDPAYADIAVKFLEHFASVAGAMNDQGMWDDEAGLYFDQLRLEDGTTRTVEVHSIVGLLPLLPAVGLPPELVGKVDVLGKRFNRLLRRERRTYEQLVDSDELQLGPDGTARLLLGVVHPDRLRSLLAHAFDERTFLSDHGVRSLSRWHLEHPYTLHLPHGDATIDYEPAESTTDMFGGNSNWRGPVWFPLNALLVDALHRYGAHFGERFTVELPTGSGHEVDLLAAADDLRRRLISVFLRGPDGRRPVFGGTERFQVDPAWRDNLLFFEYFHGDDAAGLGASHQTGWTGLVAHLIAERRDRRS
ncbi:MAG: glucosidase [Acidimicrobiales bacterium]|nr:glucosidase [Acidimicrobiales bacterium]